MERRHLHSARSTHRFGAMAGVLLAFALIFAGAVSALPGPRGAEPASTTATVSLVPSPIEIGVGLVRNVDVVVEGIEGLYAVEVRVSFPSTLVQVVDADPIAAGTQVQAGDIFDGFDTYSVQNRANNTTGAIEYIVSITGSEVGANGGGTLLSIPLQGLVAGNAVLSFVEVVLCERDGTSIPVTISSDQAPIDVVTATSTPTPTLQAGVAPATTNTPTTGPSPTSTAQTLANVRVEPTLRQIMVGNTGIVQVLVENVCDLYLFDVRLDFNGALLDAQDAGTGEAGVQVYMGDVFDGFSYQIQQNQVTDDGVFGRVQFLATINSGRAEGFCGNGVLLWVVFRGMAPGVSAATLAEVTLANHNGTTLLRTLSHGNVQIDPVGPTAVPTSTQINVPTATQTVMPTATATYTVGPSPTSTQTFTPGPSPTPTQTLSASLTPTLTATPTATGALATPTPVCSNKIVNGGFENVQGGDAPPWVVVGSTSYSGTEKHSGAYSAWLGGYANALDTLYQQVTIPSHTGPGELLTQATLGYWWGMLTEETAHSFDFMRVRIRDENGVLLQELQTISDGSTAGEWRESEFDLTAYEGQTIRICFEATTDASNATSFFVDDVELEICEILQPTPTSTATASPTISPTPTQTGLPTATSTITPTPVVVTYQVGEGSYAGSYDSTINAWEATTNFGHQGAMPIRTGGVKRLVVYFDVSSIPAGATVIDARLWLYASHYKSHAQDPTVSVYGLKRSWAEMETTWNLARTGTNWASAGADDTSADRDAVASGSAVLSTTNTWYEFDVSALAQGWVSGSRPNHGMILVATGNTVEMSFWSSEYSIANVRPKLVVQYVMGGASTPLPSSTPNVTATAGPTPTPTHTQSPLGTEVILQRDYLGYTGIEDAHISAWQPTTNYGGNVTTIVRQGDVRAILLRFDLSSLPAGSTIHDARLEMYAVSRSNMGSLNLAAYKVLRPWAEGQTTWNLATTGTSWGLAGCNNTTTDRAATATDTILVNTVNDWHRWSITPMVQSWVANPASNRGLIIKGNGATSVEYSYVASEYWWATELTPRLVVRYTAP
jgi:hypothetical protein